MTGNNDQVEPITSHADQQESASPPDEVEAPDWGSCQSVTGGADLKPEHRWTGNVR